MSAGNSLGFKAGWDGLTSTQKRIFIILIAVAMVFRLGMAAVSDDFNHPDENFQIMEQAHRLVFGYGFVPWEYRFDARSWIVPGIMSLFLFPFKWLGIDQPAVYIPGIRMIMAVISLSFVFLAFFIAVRLHSARAGLWAAFFTAIWYDMVYFAVRPLSEVWATLFFLSGLALIVSEATDCRHFWGIFLICTGMAIRVNYIPAGLITIGLFTPWGNRKALTATAPPILASIVTIGLFELVTLGRPFISYLNFFEADKTFFMKDSMGAAFSPDYILFLGYSSVFLFWVLWLAGLAMWKKSGKLAAVCLAVVVSHVIMPAKDHQIDYRHVFMVIPLTLIIGGAVVANLQKMLQKLGIEQAVNMAIIMLAFEISSAGAFAALPGQKEIYEGKTTEVYENSIFHRNPHLMAYIYLSGQKNIVGILDNSDLWFRSGGYYYLHKDIPVYFPNNWFGDLSYISHIISRNKDFVPSEFAPIMVFDDFVIYGRYDDHYPYKTDRHFTHNILQGGIDDNPALLNMLQ